MKQIDSFKAAPVQDDLAAQEYLSLATMGWIARDDCPGPDVPLGAYSLPAHWAHLAAHLLDQVPDPLSWAELNLEASSFRAIVTATGMPVPTHQGVVALTRLLVTPTDDTLERARLALALAHITGDGNDQWAAARPTAAPITPQWTDDLRHRVYALRAASLLTLQVKRPGATVEGITATQAHALSEALQATGDHPHLERGLAALPQPVRIAPYLALLYATRYPATLGAAQLLGHTLARLHEAAPRA